MSIYVPSKSDSTFDEKDAKQLFYTKSYIDSNFSSSVDNVKLNGNTVASNMVIGTNNGYNLNFETNNVNRGGFDTSGNLTLLGNVNAFGNIDAGSATIGGNVGVTGSLTSGSVSTGNITSTGSTTYSSSSGTNIVVDTANGVIDRLCISESAPPTSELNNTMVCVGSKTGQNSTLQLRSRKNTGKTGWISQTDTSMNFVEQAVGSFNFKSGSNYAASDIVGSGTTNFSISGAGPYIPPSKSLIFGSSMTGANLTLSSDVSSSYSLKLPSNAATGAGQALICSNTSTGQLDWMTINSGTGSYTPSYLPLIPKLTSTIEYFGDSNVQGYGVTSTQKFSYLLSCKNLAASKYSTMY